MQSKLPSTVLLANSLSEANGMAVTPLQADVVGNGHYATAELLAGNRFKRPEHATGTRLTRLDGRCDLLPTI